jgi:hypothetical protein
VGFCGALGMFATYLIADREKLSHFPFTAGSLPWDSLYTLSCAAKKRQIEG